jgi:hypothetical protein
LLKWQSLIFPLSGHHGIGKKLYSVNDLLEVWLGKIVRCGREVSHTSYFKNAFFSILMVIRDVNKPVLEEQLMVFFLSISTYNAINDVPKIKIA